MKFLSLLVVLFLFSFNTYAASDGAAMKPFSIGLGTYRSVITYDSAVAGDDKLSGGSLSFSYAISNQLAVRGSYFSLEHDDLSALESTGYDLLVHFGMNLASPGFKAYIGGGLFSDKWEIASFSETFSGLQLSGGLGFNWDSVALDFIIGVRDASDYEDFVNSSLSYNVTATAVTGSLLLSYRF